MNKKIFIVIIFVILVWVLGMEIHKNNKTEIDKIKSVNLSTDYEIEQVLKDVDDLGVNTVNVPVVIEIESLTSNNIKINDYSKDKAIKIIKTLKKKNINIILEAYPWISNGSDYETEYDPIDKNKFFRDWEKVLGTLINDIANKYDVDIVMVASNFEKLEGYEDDWCEIIKFVKSEFKGLVTYKTSWWYTAKWDQDSIDRYNKKLNNKIFSQVDFISIAAYFELSEKPYNTVDELVEALGSTTIHGRAQNVEREIYNFYEKHGKSIFFGELGFPRRDYAAAHPWNALVSDVENDDEQARCFEAYRRVFEGYDYFMGFSVFAAGNDGSDKNFYPSYQTKKIISNW